MDEKILSSSQHENPIITTYPRETHIHEPMWQHKYTWGERVQVHIRTYITCTLPMTHYCHILSSRSTIEEVTCKEKSKLDIHVSDGHFFQFSNSTSEENLFFWAMVQVLNTSLLRNKCTVQTLSYWHFLTLVEESTWIPAPSPNSPWARSLNCSHFIYDKDCFPTTLYFLTLKLSGSHVLNTWEHYKS